MLDNIKESFPVIKIFRNLFIFTFFGFAVLLFFLYHPLKKYFEKSIYLNLKKRIALIPSSIICCTIAFFTLNSYSSSENEILAQISYNGIYQLFSAFRANELNFNKNYETLSSENLFKKMSDEFNSPVESSSIKYPLLKKYNNTRKIEASNIVFILVESLGSNFLNSFDGTNNVTPYLDQISSESLIFKNIYAVGTRTVRGLEAVTLSLPPTPGYSIVKRPNNENLFNIGTYLRSNGYGTTFYYGGYGYFDNMNYFFSENGFDVRDRMSIPNNLVTFSNAWGVCDENMFDYVLQELDTRIAKKKKQFSLVLTTSNHRPYSYPDGKIDIPSKTGRLGAVKYTDFSIGQFIEKSKGHSWFKDTIFVIMADHSADGRGTVSIPIHTYRIPVIFYAPGKLSAREINTVASQIDVMPTLFDLLGIKYQSPFIGRDILDMDENEGRAFVATYQNLGYYSAKDELFVSLAPKKIISEYQYNYRTGELKKSTDINVPLREKAIAFYQYAFTLWNDRLLKNKSENH